MPDPLYPLLFRPVYKEYVWGGRRIPERYARTGAPTVCAESWEISAHPDGASVVANGPLAGATLAELTNRMAARLVGTRLADRARFPLLFKLIDARENLSVQVHPGDDRAGLVGGEPKTEMWYVVDCPPGAVLYAGLTRGTTPASFRAALSQGKAPELLHRLEARPGDALFIPGGLVHAIGAGCLLYEIQQSSNTTYRLYDWGRFDANGQPRPLHVHQAFQVIDPELPEPRLLRPAPEARSPWTTILACRHFRLRRLDLRQPADVRLDGTTFQALFVAAGEVAITTCGATWRLPAGTSCLVPAAAGACRIEPAASPATVLVTTCA